VNRSRPAITAIEAEAWVDGLSLALAMLWVSLDTLAERVTGVTVPLVLALFAATSAGYLVVTGNLVMGFNAGAIAALSTAAAVAAAWGRRISLSRGAVLVLIVPLVALLICSYFYGPDDPTPLRQEAAALLLISPALAWAGDLPGIRRSPAWARLCVRLIAVGLAAGIATALAARSKPPPAPTDEGWGLAAPSADIFNA
jgi:hypothetical protein